jgi:Ser/Thr protein kinase RdoA (MazF antagonist)
MQIVNSQLEIELKDFLERININIKAITFIPLGEESFGWKIVTEEQTLFLKYCIQERILNNLPKINNLLLSLANFNFVVPPVLLDGKTELPFKDGYIYVYSFVEGNVYTIRNDEFDKELVNDLIKIMGEIHNVDISNLDIPKENFDYKFKEQYERILQDIDNGKTVPEVSRSDLGKLEKVISSFDIKSQYYQQNCPEMVLTHGDITSRNILLTKDGSIKLLDWDEVKIAPKEKDINFLYDNPNFDFKYYQSITKSEDFIPDLRKYYGDVWALESVLVNIERLQYFKEEYGHIEYLLEEVVECLEYY